MHQSNIQMDALQSRALCDRIVTRLELGPVRALRRDQGVDLRLIVGRAVALSAVKHHDTVACIDLHRMGKECFDLSGQRGLGDSIRQNLVVHGDTLQVYRVGGQPAVERAQEHRIGKALVVEVTAEAAAASGKQIEIIRGAPHCTSLGQRAEIVGAIKCTVADVAVELGQMPPRPAV